jgi:hypothetical protein
MGMWIATVQVTVQGRAAHCACKREGLREYHEFDIKR